MKTKHSQKDRNGRHAGFTMLEMMVSMVVLAIVVGVVAQGMSMIQLRNNSQINKVALTQESRQFMDQILRDLRQSGYPGVAMFDPATLTSTTMCSLNLNVACGLTSFSSTALVFEGDIDGSGVSQVYIQLAQNVNGGACVTLPCVLRRGTVLKSVGGTPPYYTELNNVQSTTIFTAYKYDGTTYNAAGGDTLSMIRNIGINLYVQGSQADAGTKTYPTVTMISEARINNGSQDQ
jgi:prepilin-type N-terminal cleavage/methylation domain-containing protein